MLFPYKKLTQQSGFTLIELMVGLVIGMLTTLVIMQTFSTFEGRKRTTTGTADAQTNGSIALFSVQRDLQMAGFGLPVFDTQNPPLKCDPAVSTSVTVDHDGVAATAAISLSPITITDGGATGNDTIAVRYSTDGATTSGGVATKIIGTPSLPTVGVDNNLGCKNGDVVIMSFGTVCAMTRVNDTDFTDTKNITLHNSAGATVGGSLTCMGRWNQVTYIIANNQLLRNVASSNTATPIVAEIVNLQAQYGVSATANSNVITQWVSATGGWDSAAISIANRNRIRAVRIALVARNGLLEKENVTGTCTTAKGTVNNGPCAWDDASVEAAPKIDISTISADWQRYRYRVYETIIPLRNMVWAKNTM